MKNVERLLLIAGICIMTSFSCDEKNANLDVDNCAQGRVIAQTCGGTAIQILSDVPLGESWVNHFENPANTYNKAILVGNASQSYVKGDIISFSYKVVKNFSNGNNCDIGGLPKIRVEIVNVHSNCDSNENM